MAWNTVVVFGCARAKPNVRTTKCRVVAWSALYRTSQSSFYHSVFPSINTARDTKRWCFHYCSSTDFGNETKNSYWQISIRNVRLACTRLSGLETYGVSIFLLNRTKAMLDLLVRNIEYKIWKSIFFFFLISCLLNVLYSSFILSSLILLDCHN